MEKRWVACIQQRVRMEGEVRMERKKWGEIKVRVLLRELENARLTVLMLDHWAGSIFPEQPLFGFSKKGFVDCWQIVAGVGADDGNVP